MGQEQIQENKLKNYEELLQVAIEEGKISDWKINTHQNRKSNFYVQSDYKIESILNSLREDMVFTIYKDYGEEIGESEFTLSGQDDENKFKEELDMAIFACSLSKSKKYVLPKKEDNIVDDSNIDYEKFYNKKYESDFKNNSLNLFFEEKLSSFKNIINKNSDENIKLVLNYLELLNSFSELSMKSSRDIHKSFKKEKAYMEYVITAVDLKTKKEMEYIVYENINDIYEFNFEKFFNRTCDMAKNALSAQKPDNFEGKVILSEKAVRDFFVPDLTMNSIIGYASGRLKFLGISNYEKENNVIESKYDKITIYSNPLVENNLGSSPYDSDGVTARRVCLIENSVFKNFFASKQYADYLGATATGPFGVVEVETGSSTEDELLEDNDKYVIIDSFASFVPDIITGDFSAEIRYGYIVENGVRVPFRGGLFSGNIFEILKEAEFSKEKVTMPMYVGPKTIKFHKGEIVGV